MNKFVYNVNDNIFYNDFLKQTKTIVRCCLDIVVDVDLEAKVYSTFIQRGQVYFEHWH